MYEEKIKKSRDKIDEIDNQLLSLLNDRAKLSLKIRSLKKADGSPLFNPQRESEIISKLTQDNKGPLYDQDVEKIFKLIMKQMRELPDEQ